MLLRKVMAFAVLLIPSIGHGAAAATGALDSRPMWFDLLATEPAAAQTFYAAVFDWTFEPTSPGYSIIKQDGNAIGGVFDMTRTQNSKDGLAVYFAVSDLEETLEKARANGANIVLAPTPSPDRQKIFALFVDPSGRTVGLVAASSGKE